MDNKSHDLEQENIRLRQAVINEQLNKAEEVFTQRLVFTTIIFVILFLVLVSFLDGASSGVQWLFIIIFFVIALGTAGKIFNTYTREKDEINRSQ